jgi:hypothetical protein
MCGAFGGFGFSKKELSWITGLIMGQALVCERLWPG